eukprot:GEZU01000364.1.p1 GENE.GEZU01000364.1~~GEZU01000364.1.p1  ORF type:complete len:386 (+),score=106.93 GEZU01000364.1:20-1177(+)
MGKPKKSSKKGWKKTDLGTTKEDYEAIVRKETLEANASKVDSSKLFFVEKKSKPTKTKQLKNTSIKVLESDPLIRPVTRSHASTKLNTRYIMVEKFVEKLKNKQEKNDKTPVVNIRKKVAKPKYDFDVWATEDPHAKDKKKYEYLDHMRKAKTTRKSKSGKEVHSDKLAKPVVLPHDGQSYNPDPEKLQEAINIAHKSHVKNEKIARKTMQKLTPNPELEHVEGNDAIVGLMIDEQPDEPQIEEPHPLPQPTERKTEEEREKIIRKKIIKHKEEIRLQKKKMAEDIANIDAIVKELDEKEANKKHSRVKKRLNKEKREARAKTAPINSLSDVLLPSEITGSLRTTAVRPGIYFRDRVDRYMIRKMLLPVGNRGERRRLLQEASLG